MAQAPVRKANTNIPRPLQPGSTLPVKAGSNGPGDEGSGPGLVVHSMNDVTHVTTSPGHRPPGDGSYGYGVDHGTKTSAPTVPTTRVSKH